MSGHNKWSKIKNKKAVSDAKKSKTFGKIVRLISVEAKKAQGNPEAPGLKMAIQKAKEANMPADNIERAIKKATSTDSEALEAITYETYGPGGVAIIIETLTDNRNKSSAEIRHILSKNGFELATPGSATWAFEKKEIGWKPNTTIDLSDEDAHRLSLIVEELEENDATQEIFTNAN